MHILTDDNLTGAQLAQAYEDNMAALFRQFAAVLGGDIEEGDFGGRHCTFPDHLTFKSGWNSRLSPEQADDVIAETVAWFRARGETSFGWWTHGGTTPDDIGFRLLEHGFEPMHPRGGLDPAIPSTAQGAPVMGIDLRRIDDSVLDKTPPGFHIERVETEADLAAFVRIVDAYFPRPPSIAEAWAAATRHVGAANTPWKLYLGWLDDEPVATNVVSEGGGSVGVWNIATLEQHRGKGIGAAITVAPLLESRALGYRYAGLFASPLGAPVYERLGFQFTGTKLNRYVWRP